MPVKNQGIVEDEIRDLSLLMETARDLVTNLSELTFSVEQCLGNTTDVDEVVSLLRQKKAKVDTLNAVALEITGRLRLSADGEPGLAVPDGLKIRFRELMADFSRLLDQESRLEGLIAGRGFPVSRRLR